jgi:hypothetical protein
MQRLVKSYLAAYRADPRGGGGDGSGSGAAATPAAAPSSAAAKARALYNQLLQTNRQCVTERSVLAGGDAAARGRQRSHGAGARRPPTAGAAGEEAREAPLVKSTSAPEDMHLPPLPAPAQEPARWAAAAAAAAAARPAASIAAPHAVADLALGGSNLSLTRVSDAGSAHSFARRRARVAQ